MTPPMVIPEPVVHVGAGACAVNAAAGTAVARRETMKKMSGSMASENEVATCLNDQLKKMGVLNL